MAEADEAEALISLSGITKVYGEGDAEVHALRSVDFVINRGDFVAVMGPSGSGKSTLMNILGCLDIPSTGTYLFGGEDVSGMSEKQLARVRNRRIGFVFQQFHLLAGIPAWRNVELPLRYRRAEERREKALAVLGRVGLAHRVDHKPNQLSGGQQQRVAIARALITEPDIILADEPTGNLDSASSHEILEMLRELNREGRTVIVITHDADVAAIARRRLIMADGNLAEAAA